MSNVYYGVEPYTGKIIQHFGIPGMKWGWTKNGKKTGAKEAMTEQERAQRRKDLIKKIGAGVGIAAGIAGTSLAIKNRKKIGNFVKTKINRYKDNKMFKKVNKKLKKQHYDNAITRALQKARKKTQIAPWAKKVLKIK